MEMYVCYTHVKPVSRKMVLSFQMVDTEGHKAEED